ncbi:hypothetical protein OJF2_05340 [Aquisphaera giovannonii]|uniref:Uncharacterized protein n=1 Tax=Aquisphaera giovannonii TaxID=406548 RepID=A0A5B9VWA8_9BACT|nr:hypothetical protein [Aquisphaera giovannonii]QEH32065.1 hypothetical protein OJF2_05340 [Aquisphaera giovannonii]
MNDSVPDPDATLPSDGLRATEVIRGGAAAPLQVLRDLAGLAAQLGRIQEAVAADIGEGSEAGEAPSAAEAIRASLARIEAKIDDLSGRLGAPPAAPTALPAEDSRSRSESGPSASPGPEENNSAAGWGRVILGDDLWAEPEIASDRARLLDQFLDREPAACSFAAQLLLFQCAPPARRSLMMKDLGEAYYQWQPQLDDGVMPLEVALARWAAGLCEAAGLGHRIELVRPGSRFNPQQHRSLDRGVEVLRALGWVVLREDGSVFQKASVNVR